MAKMKPRHKFVAAREDIRENRPLSVPEKKAFAAVAEHDRKRIAPGGGVIRQMLPDGPALTPRDTA